LQPDRNKRPATAAETYLQLHELGKASGALHLTPETIHRIATAVGRAAPGGAETVTYVARRFPEISRRGWFLAGSAAIFAVIVAIVASGGGSNPIADESLAGVELVNNRDDVVVKLGKPIVVTGDPWETRPQLLGRLLRPSDLPASGRRDAWELLSYSDDHIGVLVEGKDVRAVIARAPQSAKTGRNLGIGDSERRLKQAYDEPTELDKVHYEADDGAGRTRSAWGMIFRYSARGLSIEVRDERVTGIALYPPKK
jgi:hypothetical protein